MLELLILMLERLGIIVMLAFLLTRFSFFRNLVFSRELNGKQQMIAILFFGLIGIIGTYTGFVFNNKTFDIGRWGIEVTPDEAIANFRVIGVVVAGLLGGYRIGIGAGLVAGIHRLWLGGYTAISCGVATIIAGAFAGYFLGRNKKVSFKKVFVIAACAEAMQMLLILLISRPLDKVISLVETIGVPMIVVNGLGAVLFMVIIQNVISSEERHGATQTQFALRMTDRTLVHLREGLNETSAEQVCEILYNELKPLAVSITNETVILAHMGEGSDHHKKGGPIQTQVTLEAIKDGELCIASEREVGCAKADCPLQAVIIAPLKLYDKPIGTLKFYYRSEEEISLSVKELITGLSVLLSNQLEIAEADRALALAKEAEINALQAQISPHFLFNTLNTISSLIRINPKKARKLLLSLSNYLRHNVSSTTVKKTTLEQELSHMRAYLNIEETRFSDRLSVDYDIDYAILQEKIAPLTLQPIIENAVKHGLRNKEQDGLINIQIKDCDDHIFISVVDNGEGISEERLNKLGEQIIQSHPGTGMALFNVNRRLTILFGNKAKLHIESKRGEGTRVSFIVPKQAEYTTEGENDESKDSYTCSG
ncbi:sensor histidine kinase [Lentibacillus cibarius]|uniref:histidine kinase n=1 Tax=Lentibacillus cibarius TaxID=2583219 RepID=A0A549YIF0_9BACI|nr:sensor histidine kinase [Lentibacillus cibarius]TRM11655.1 sensor histidine kinase [Lentibacillus cibarius]